MIYVSGILGLLVVYGLFSVILRTSSGRIRTPTFLSILALFMLATYGASSLIYRIYELYAQ